MVDKAFLRTHETIVELVSQFIFMFKSPLITRSFELTELFMREIIYLQGSVGELYTGSSYCSGLLFGINGGRLMIGLGNAFTGGSKTAW